MPKEPEARKEGTAGCQNLVTRARVKENAFRFNLFFAFNAVQWLIGDKLPSVGGYTDCRT